MAAATELGIAVANAPTYCTEVAAEHAMAMLLALSRQLEVRHEQMRGGLWAPGSVPIRRLQTTTVGVVGLGRIGRRVAELVRTFGAAVLGYDVVDVAADGVDTVDLPTLLAKWRCAGRPWSGSPAVGPPRS